MATRSQIARIEQRIDALATARGTKRIIVVSPGETKEEALQRQGLHRSAVAQIIFIHTGVPRSW